MNTLEVTINNDGLSLEACLEFPGSPGPCPGVVLCHPHPLYGGDMDNNVILAVSRALTGEGIACLRFNFRGVGRSGGSFAGGTGEKDDARAALSFLARREEIDPDRIGILGYSFGGMVALSAGARSDAVKALAAVSPVVPAGVPGDCVKPKFIVCGSEDKMIPSPAILEEAAKMAGPKTVEVISGADHFWWGYEEKLTNLVVDFFAKQFKQGRL